MIGINSDRLRAQKRFVERDSLPFPLLRDETGSTLRAYGARGFLGYARRVSYLIDPAGVVRRVYVKVSPRVHAEEVLQDLQTLTES